jgi:nitrogen fixation protein NifU and related proteins
MVGPQLRALVSTAVGAGVLAGPDVGIGRGEHPICGDEVEVYVRVRDGCIAELRWRATGCPASTAVAAVAATAMVGAAPADAPARLRAGLAERGDLAAHERHAEAMFLRALQGALAAAAAGGN